MKKTLKLFNNPYLVRELEIPSAKIIQRLYRFHNGYGASVVRLDRHSPITNNFVYGSHTNNEDEWDLVVIRWVGKKYKLDYSTPITDDVLGHLTENLVEEILKKIKNLKRKNKVNKLNKKYEKNNLSN